LREKDNLEMSLREACRRKPRDENLQMFEKMDAVTQIGKEELRRI
jgi:hypothetical protein